jgi:hypothetical protein
MHEPDGCELSPSSARSKRAPRLAAEEEDRGDIETTDHRHGARNLSRLRLKAQWPVSREALEDGVSLKLF